ncbi:MAG: DUF4867 family protein [Sphaerochaetaceae bacterium]|nr:DUF4867 family protein [Sphaerochaetaceae bacterium]
MLIKSVTDESFREYGKVLEGYDNSDLIKRMKTIPMPGTGTAYEASIPVLEESLLFPEYRDREYGGMPVQIGMCWGFNTRLNCLEYHRDSEVNIGESDFILLLARQSSIEGGKLDTSSVRAFRVPAGVAVEVYATTLHYAPCQSSDAGFRVAVILPRGTNTGKPAFSAKCAEDRWMTARNKWLLSHADSDEARNGAYVGLVGENIDIRREI